MPTNELATGGAAVSATNPIPVTSGTGSTFDVSDRAARDLGKVDVAGIDAVGAIAGQTTMAGSIPVAVASDQSNVPVSQATHDSLNLNANMQVGDADVGGGNPVPVTLATTLDSSTDSIDVDKMSKGGVLTAASIGLSGIESNTTGLEMDFRGHNSAHVQVIMTGSGDWSFSLQGSPTTGGTFVDEYVNGVKVSEDNLTASRNFVFPVGANYAKIVATENSGTASVSVTVTPYNS